MKYLTTFAAHICECDFAGVILFSYSNNPSKLIFILVYRDCESRCFCTDKSQEMVNINCGDNLPRFCLQRCRYCMHRRIVFLFEKLTGFVG